MADGASRQHSKVITMVGNSFLFKDLHKIVPARACPRMLESGAHRRRQCHYTARHGTARQDNTTTLGRFCVILFYKTIDALIHPNDNLIFLSKLIQKMRQLQKGFSFVISVVMPILSMPSFVQAQDAQTTQKTTADAKAIAKPQEVEIKAKSDIENSRRDTAAKTIITNEELTRYGDSTIAEAMKRVPSVSVVKGIMQLPGLNAGYTQVLVDGEPPRGVNVNDIPMSTIDRVEVYRIGSAEFSSQAIAGTINIVLKKITRAAQQQIKVNLTNEAALTPSVDWLLSDKAGDFSYSLATMIREYQFPTSSQTITQTFDRNNALQKSSQQNFQYENKFQNFFINPVLQYKTSSGLNIRSSTSFNTSRSDSHSSEDYDFKMGIPLSIGSIKKIAHMNDRGGGTSLKLSNTLNRDFKLDLNVNLNGSISEHHGNELNYSPDKKLVYERQTNSKTRVGGVSSSLKITAPSNEEHDIVSGWNFSTNHNNDSRLQVDTGPTYFTPEPNLQNTNSIIDNLAFYIQDEWRFRKESSAYFGLRWETVRVQSEGNIQTSVKNTSSVWSPIIRTMWQLNPENTDRVRLGVSRTYKSPPNFYLITPKFIAANNAFENPSMRGNPRLKPELAWSFEASYEHNDKEELSYSVRAIVRKISDLHRMKISYFDNAWWRQIANAGEALSKRFDFETRFPLKRFFTNSPDINIGFNASRNWSSVSYLPKPENLLSDSKFNVGTSLDFTAKDIPLSLGTSMRYRDAHPMLASINQRNLGHSKTELDFYALWKFSSKTKLRFSADGLLKRRAIWARQFFDTDSTIWQDIEYKGYRTVKLNFEHNF
jgi:outer membrane receptor for ferrienterochelin and colicins